MSLLKNLTFVDLICVFRTKDAGDDKINFDVLFKGGDKDLEMLKKKNIRKQMWCFQKSTKALVVLQSLTELTIASKF